MIGEGGGTWVVKHVGGQKKEQQGKVIFLYITILDANKGGLLKRG